MRLKPSDLDTCSSPFRVWQPDFLAAMRDMVGFSGTDENLLSLLFNDVLPFVKHQYTLYDCLAPAMTCMEELLERAPFHTASIVSFLGFLFQEPIRDATFIFVDPVQYRHLQPGLSAMTPLESALFASVKALYGRRRPGLTGTTLRDYFDVTLLDRIEETAPTGSNDADQLSRLLATAVTRYKLGMPLISESGITIAEPRFKDLGAALQGRAFERRALYRLLEDDTVVDDVPWAGGRLGVIAGIVLFLSTTPTEPARAEVLEQLVETCAELKKHRSGDEEDAGIATDEFLLEDLSVVLFRDHLGATSAVPMDAMHEDQRRFLALLLHIYRGHTFSLLNAGIAPEGVDAAKLGLESSIYML